MNPIFKGQILWGIQDISCTMCQELKVDVRYSTICMHPVCDSCLIRKRFTISSIYIACPACDVPAKSWVQHTFAQRIIRKLEVECEYKCGTPLLFSEYKNHYQKCLMRPVECDHDGCNWTGTVGTRSSHDKVCMYKMGVCLHCMRQFHAGALPSHELSCNYVLVRCDNCYVEVQRWRLPTHLCTTAADDAEFMRLSGMTTRLAVPRPQDDSDNESLPSLE